MRRALKNFELEDDWRLREFEIYQSYCHISKINLLEDEAPDWPLPLEKDEILEVEARQASVPPALKNEDKKGTRMPNGPSSNELRYGFGSNNVKSTQCQHVRRCEGPPPPC